MNLEEELFLCHFHLPLLFLSYFKKPENIFRVSSEVEKCERLLGKARNDGRNTNHQRGYNIVLFRVLPNIRDCFGNSVEIRGKVFYTPGKITCKSITNSQSLFIVVKALTLHTVQDGLCTGRTIPILLSNYRNLAFQSISSHVSMILFCKHVYCTND